VISQLQHIAIGRRALAVAAAGLILAALLPASGNSTGFRTVTVTIRHSRFLPAQFTVRRGATVRFVFTNTDPIDHEFILGEDAVQRRHETGTEPEHGAIPGEVSIPAGKTAETTYTFNEGGLLLIGCHAPGHYAYGMRGWVRILE
jgi:uncharacterized cupredoxin-like copper-binding protein